MGGLAHRRAVATARRYLINRTLVWSVANDPYTILSRPDRYFATLLAVQSHED